MGEFKGKIEPLIKVIDKLCMENGIQYWSEFHMGNGEKAFYHTPEMLLDMTTLYSHIQMWEAKKEKQNCNNVTINLNVDKTCSTKSLLEMLKIELNKLR